MRFFSKTKKTAGWMATSFQSDGICVAHVVRHPSSLPSVELAGFFPFAEPLAAPALEKVAKDISADRYQCTTPLSFGEYQLLSVDAPNVPPEELKAAIRWRLKDMLDYHIDDAAVDVVDIPAEKNAPSRNRQMLVVSARNHLIQQRQALFAKAKVPLSVIDVPEMAQRNISHLLEPEGRGLALLSFDADGGLLTVTYAGELYLSRRIEVSLARLDSADESQRIESFDRITLELQRSLDHFDRQYHFITLSKLVLGPMAQGGSSLQQYLASNLYLPVDELNLGMILDLSKVPDLRQVALQQRFFMTIGAALRHEEKAL